MPPPRPTIFALSSGRPPAAIAVIRISGPRARVALETMTGRLPQPRVATFARVRDPLTHEVIDEGLALWFPAPKSETGEDCAELQIHGGRAVVADTLATLGRLEGFRHAEAGEFTRRAFENGRLDLTAVEGLADLVAAETQAQRAQALRQMQGEFARAAERWRTRLTEARALLEAGIDFSDEGDVPGNLAAQALAVIRPVRDELGQARRGQGERLREGLQIAIAGAPNVGKSTLLNRIAQRDVAIVSPYAGTTRDVIEVHLDLGGYPVTLRDTAGIRPTDDPVEQEGVRRARASAGSADLVLWLVDASEIEAGDVIEAAKQMRAATGQAGAEVPAAAAEALNEQAAIPGAGRLWLVINKIDLLSPEATGAASRSTLGRFSGADPDSNIPRHSREYGHGEPQGEGSRITESGRGQKPRDPAFLNSPFFEKNEPIFKLTNTPHFFISAATGQGLAALLAQITKFAREFFSGEPALVTRQRHRQMIGDAIGALSDALALAEAQGAEGCEELIAEQVRLATRALERLTGRVDVEDVLDVIFRDFCIGK